MSDETEEGKTGYKTPPKSSQFKKGQSGNKKGRPKGAKNNKKIFEALANSIVQNKTSAGSSSITLREGVISMLISKALAGDQRAMNKVIDTLQVYDEKNERYSLEAECKA